MCYCASVCVCNPDFLQEVSRDLLKISITVIIVGRVGRWGALVEGPCADKAQSASCLVS